MKVLGDRVIESAEPAVSAADMWLALSQPERDATAVFASGRDARAVINQRIQDGLVAEGSVKGEHIQRTVHAREIGRTAGRDRAGEDVSISGVPGTLKKN